MFNGFTNIQRNKAASYLPYSATSSLYEGKLKGYISHRLLVLVPVLLYPTQKGLPPT
jgi:hypothetical protein